MALNHGINTYKAKTNFTSAKQTSGSGIPVFIGAWPCHTAGGYTGKPQLAKSYDEAVKLGGYSDEWRTSTGTPKWNLCQAMYSHFKVFKMAPAIFINVFDPSKHYTGVESASFVVSDHSVELPVEAINDENLVVTDDSTTLALNTDYTVAYDEDKLLVMLVATSTHYNATNLSIAYHAADPSQITSSMIISAIEQIELCQAEVGLEPDLICAPGWSSSDTVAAVMAVKAENINGMFGGTAVIDIDSTASGVTAYSDLLEYKASHNLNEASMIDVWPMAMVGDKLFDGSVIVCGEIAQVDAANDGTPNESPSNKAVPITAVVLASGEEVNLTNLQADYVSHTAGIITFINSKGWRLWGNFTGAQPDEPEYDKKYISCYRMMWYVRNEFVRRYSDYVDRPLSRVLIDAIVNDFNSFLAGLTQSGKLCGGKIEYVDDNNPAENLIAGRFRLDCKLASPNPAEQINLYVEYDVDMLKDSINV
ncbi:MAG: phage tail sheath family protein [Christensenellales bacterium]